MFMMTPAIALAGLLRRIRIHVGKSASIRISVSLKAAIITYPP